MEVISLIGAFLLVIACGAFVAAEFALITVNRNEAKAAAEGGDRRAASVLKGMNTLSTQLSGAQLGITLTNLGIGFLAEPAVASLVVGPLVDLGLGGALARTISVAIALVLATLITMVFGELVPKNLAIAKPLLTARYVTGFQRGFSAAMKPLLIFFNGTANAILRMLRIEPQEELASARSPEELVALGDHSARVGTLSLGTADLLKRSVAFGARRGRDAMTPRSRIVTVVAETTIADMLALSGATGHSRFPVVDPSGGRVEGMAHVRRGLAVPHEARDTTPVAEVMVDAISVPDTVELDVLMDTLRGGRLQIAMLVDETGDIAGLLTLEDLVEELVGNVVDEHDPEPSFRQVDEGEWIVDATLRPDEATDMLGVVIPEGSNYDTLAGWVVLHLGRIAEVGDVLRLETHDDYVVSLTVEEMTGAAITQLRVHVADATSEERDQ